MIPVDVMPEVRRLDEMLGGDLPSGDSVPAGMRPVTDWYSCVHEWVEPIDSPHDREVICRKCSCPGDRNPTTGEVYWPAT